ncbi:MAG: PAS domain S-box protein, partial [Bacteroides sp.]|nr:PAS domain S-box protein [Bacteroides sp.]
LLGYSKDELILLSVPDINPEFPAEKWPDRFADFREKRIISSYESVQRTKEGRIIPVEITATYLEFEGQEYNCAVIRDISERKITENTLLFISERSWAKPGGDFFSTIARYLGETLSVDYVFINRVSSDGQKASSLANYRLGELSANFEYSMAGSPCENIYGKKLCSYPSNIQQEFPLDKGLVELEAECYIGIPLWDSLGNPVGLIAILHRKPFQNIQAIESLLRLVAPHTGPEIERVEAERKLRSSEEKYRNIFENIQDVFYQTNLEGIVLEMSPSIKHFSEFNRDEIVGYPVHKLYDNPKDRKPLLAALEKDGELKDYEVKLKTSEGGSKFASINARMIFDADKKPLRISGSIRDITDRKKVEEALKEREFFFKESQKAAFIGSYKTNFSDGYWESSEVLDQIFGIDKDSDRSIPGWIDIVHPDDREMMNTYLEKDVLTERNPFRKEYRILRKNDQQVRWVFGQGIAGFDKDGKPLSLIGTIQDITERKLDEDKISKLNYAVEASSEVIFMTDLEGIITYMNPAFTTVYGHKAEDVVGKVTPRILKSGVMDESAYKYFWDEILNKRVIVGELINKTKDGRNIPVEASNNAIVNEDGTIIGFISIQKDISVRKESEDELLQAKEKAEESDRLKSAFLSNMSHEIRTPMNGILGFAALLKEPTLTSDELQEYIETIQISGERMLNTINSIVDVSKIESGLIEVDISETNINEKIDFLFRFFKPETEKKGLKISVNKGLPLEQAFIKTDSEKVYGVLTNLVKNAIKFTHEGSIEFGYEKNGDFLEFFVKDSGIGIQGEQQELIFERFRQGS